MKVCSFDREKYEKYANTKDSQNPEREILNLTWG